MRLYRGYTGINGKENGNYYIITRVYIGFEGLSIFWRILEQRSLPLTL